MLQQLNHNRTKAWTKVEMERKSYIFEMVFRKQSITLLAQKVRTSKEIRN